MTSPILSARIYLSHKSRDEIQLFKFQLQSFSSGSHAVPKKWSEALDRGASFCFVAGVLLGFYFFFEWNWDAWKYSFFKLHTLWVYSETRRGEYACTRAWMQYFPNLWIICTVYTTITVQSCSPIYPGPPPSSATSLDSFSFACSWIPAVLFFYPLSFTDHRLSTEPTVWMLIYLTNWQMQHQTKDLKCSCLVSSLSLIL